MSSAWPAPPKSDASWSMSPPGTPVAATSAASASARRVDPVERESAESARASVSATASAELDDSPDPTGTVDVTSRSAPATATPALDERAHDARRRTGPTAARPSAGRSLPSTGDVDARRRARRDGACTAPSVRRRVDPRPAAAVDRQRQDEAVVVVGVVAHEVHPSRGADAGAAARGSRRHYVGRSLTSPRCRPSSILVA